MKKIFLALLIASAYSNVSAQVDISIKRSTNWSALLSKVVNRTVNTIPSAAVSVAIGALSGGLVALFDNSNFLISLLTAWPAEMYLRNTVVENVEEEMDSAGVSYDRQTMYWAARIASWVAWLMLIKDNPAVTIKPIIIHHN